MALSLKKIFVKKSEVEGIVPKNSSASKSKPWEPLEKGPTLRTLSAREAVHNARQNKKSNIVLGKSSYTIIALDNDPILQQVGVHPRGIWDLIKLLLNI